jgi:hypothetical protein
MRVRHAPAARSQRAAALILRRRDDWFGCVGNMVRLQILPSHGLPIAQRAMAIKRTSPFSQMAFRHLPSHTTTDAQKFTNLTNGKRKVSERRSVSLRWPRLNRSEPSAARGTHILVCFLDECLALFTSTHNEDPPGKDWFLACEIRLPFSPINWRPRTRRIRAIRVESELRLTARESRSRGSGASLDVPEGSMLAMTLLPGA